MDKNKPTKAKNAKKKQNAPVAKFCEANVTTADDFCSKNNIMWHSVHLESIRWSWQVDCWNEPKINHSLVNSKKLKGNIKK